MAKKCDSRRPDCRSVAGYWLFSGRRWRNPAVVDDRAELNAGYSYLVAAFPGFSHCPYNRFIEVVGEVCDSWSRRFGEVSVSLALPSTPPLHATSPSAVQDTEAGRDGCPCFDGSTEERTYESWSSADEVSSCKFTGTSERQLHRASDSIEAIVFFEP